MATRYYTAPPDDPNGNAGQVIGTDDQGGFWIAKPEELAGAQPTAPSQPQPGGSATAATGTPPTFDPTKGPDNGPGIVGGEWHQDANGRWVRGGAANGSAGRTGGTNPLGGLVDAVVQSNTDEWRLKLRQAEDAMRLANNADQRAQAQLKINEAQQNLNRWQAIANDANAKAQIWSNLSTTLLNNAVQLANSPRDAFKFNQYTSGGRDIFAQMYGNEPRPDFSAPTGPIEPGNIGDLLKKLGMPAMPGGPAEAPPAPLDPSAPPTSTPGGGSSGSTLPPVDEMLSRLDQAAGGHWDGDRTNPEAVANAFWGADPAHQGQPRPPLPGAGTSGGTASGGATLPSVDVMLGGLDQAAGGHWTGDRNNPEAVANAFWGADPAHQGQPRPPLAGSAPQQQRSAQVATAAAPAAPAQPAAPATTQENEMNSQARFAGQGPANAAMLQKLMGQVGQGGADTDMGMRDWFARQPRRAPTTPTTPIGRAYAGMVNEPWHTYPGQPAGGAGPGVNLPRTAMPAPSPGAVFAPTDDAYSRAVYGTGAGATPVPGRQSIQPVATRPVAPATGVQSNWGTTPDGHPIPMPHVFGGARWDALGPYGQQLMLGAVEAAGGNADEYQYQINQSRPRGTARQTTGVDYGARFAGVR